MAKDMIHGDRRLQRRYPIELDLEFRIVDGDKVVYAGVGKTEKLNWPEAFCFMPRSRCWAALKSSFPSVGLRSSATRRFSSCAFSAVWCVTTRGVSPCG